MFHKEQKRSFKNNGFLTQNLFYNAQKDYFACPMGQQMKHTGTGKRKSESGYESTVDYYQAERCQGCPLRCFCHKSKENRRIEVNHRLNGLRQQAKELLTSEKGLIYRSRRPIEPEAVFGQMKENKNYKRFRHFGRDKVKMDFAIFVIAFNIGKLYNKSRKNTCKGKNRRDNSPKTNFFIVFFIIIPRKMQIQEFARISQNWAA